MTDREATNGFARLVRPAATPTEEVSRGQLARDFGQLGLAVHRAVDAMPDEFLAMGDEVGLSPAWIVGHLALLLRSVAENLGGQEGELPPGFADAFSPGRDGTEVRDEPSRLIGLFDRHLAMVSALLEHAGAGVLTEPPRRDDFRLAVLSPHRSLGGHADAALRYAGMYVMELAMLCDTP